MHYGGADRVGTYGSITPDLKFRDLVIAIGAITDSNINHDRSGSISFATESTMPNLEENISLLRNYGVLAVDMETAELYTLAAKQLRLDESPSPGHHLITYYSQQRRLYYVDD